MTPEDHGQATTPSAGFELLRARDRVRHRITGERGQLLKIGSEVIRSAVVLWDVPAGSSGRPQRGIGWLHDLEELPPHA